MGSSIPPESGAPELGALGLKLYAEGEAAVQAALDRVDTRAKQTDATLQRSTAAVAQSLATVEKAAQTSAAAVISTIEQQDKTRAASLVRTQNESAERVARIQAEADAMVANGAVIDNVTGRIRTSGRQRKEIYDATNRAAAEAAGTFVASVQKEADAVEQANARKLAAFRAELEARRANAANSLKDLDDVAKRVKLLGQGVEFDGTRARSLAELRALEFALNAELQKGNLALERRIGLEAQLSNVKRSIADAPVDPVRASPTLSGLVDTAKSFALGAGALVAFQLVSKSVESFKDSARVFDEVEAANRKLAATAKITGAELASLEDIARRGQDVFKLSRKETVDFTVEVTKLAEKAGRLDLAKDALQSFLDLGAARGLSTERTLKALQQTILGIDDGTDKLFNRNPSDLYKEYAESIGKTVKQLNDHERALAILSIAMRESGSVFGEYIKRLETAAGKEELAAKASDRLKLAIGTMFAGVREGIASNATSITNFFASIIEGANGAIKKLDEMNVRLSLRGAGPFLIPTLLPKSREPERVAPPEVTYRQLDTNQPRPPKTKEELEAERKEREKAAREALDAARARQQAIASEISALETLGRLNLLNLADLNRAFELEKKLNDELTRGNVTRERRAEIEEQKRRLVDVGFSDLDRRLDVRDVLSRDLPQGPATELQSIDLQLVVKPKLSLDQQMLRDELQALYRQLATAPGATQNAAAEAIAKRLFSGQMLDDKFKDWAERVGQSASNVDQVFASVGPRISEALGSALAEGFRAGPKAAGKVLGGALGNIMIEMGQALMTYGLTMIGLLPSLSNPFLSGPAALAAGAALLALGGTLGGIAGGRRTGVGSNSRGSGANELPLDIRRVIGDPNSPSGRALISRTERRAVEGTATTNTFVFPLMNPNDPATQRLVNQAVKKGGGRGL